MKQTIGEELEQFCIYIYIYKWMMDSGCEKRVWLIANKGATLSMRHLEERKSGYL